MGPAAIIRFILSIFLFFMVQLVDTILYVVLQSRRRQIEEIRSRLQELNQQAVDSLDVSAKSELKTLPSGVKLHIVSAGPENGELVILLHGFPENWYCWHNQIPALAAAGYRVVAADMRGYNLSDKPLGKHHYLPNILASDIDGLITSLGRTKASIVCHDWGAVAGWWFAMLYPDRISKLVVLNGPHPVAFLRVLRQSFAQKLRSWYILYFQLPYLPELAIAVWPFRLATVVYNQLSRKGAIPKLMMDLNASMCAQRGAATAMLNYYRAIVQLKMSVKPKPIDTPVLMIWGIKDTAVGVEMTTGLEKWVPNLTLELVPTFHWVQNEAPEKVNESTLRFLREK